MEKSRIFQIINAGRTNLSKQNNFPLTKLGIPQPPHYPIGVKRVNINSPNVEGTVFQTFLNYKQRSCIQFITNEQVKLISFIWEGVDFMLGILYVPLRHSLFRKVKQNLYFKEIQTISVLMKWSLIKIDLVTNGELLLTLLEKWGTPLVLWKACPAPLLNSCANLHPTQSIRANVKKQVSLHTNRREIGGQNTLVGIFTYILNTGLCVLNPLKTAFVTVSFNW